MFGKRAGNTMIPSPTPPYFSYNREHHRIEMAETVETKLEVPLRNIICGADAAWVSYDAAGVTWSFSYARPAGGFSIFKRLLAQPLLGPFLFLRETAITWIASGPYQFSELREACLRGIAVDDGWLTRFVERAELEQRVRGCQTFEDLVRTWRWTKPDAPDDPTEA